MTGKKSDTGDKDAIETTDPSTGRGSTADPHQADLNDMHPWPKADTDVPETADEAEATTPDADAVPGTTKDPNQADRT